MTLIKILNSNDLIRQFIMEAGFFIPSSVIESSQLIQNLNYLNRNSNLLKQYITFEAIITESREKIKINTVKNEQSLDMLYISNPDNLYFSGDYYGNSRWNQSPTIEVKLTVASDGTIIVIKYDHRIIDGREAVSFLTRVKETIEDPRRLIIGV